MSEKSINKVIFCKKCVESNQRYMGSIQHLDTKDNFKQRTSLEDGVCGACKYFDQKKKLNNLNWSCFKCLILLALYIV